MNKQGFVHIYTGDGKGKSTACAGLALRMLGAGGKVLFVQFLKDGNGSEVAMLKKLGAATLADYPFHKFVFAMTAKERETCKILQTQCLSTARKKAEAEEFDLIVLDEVLPAAALGLIPMDELTEMIRNKNPQTELVLSGRETTDELLNLADYVSIIQKGKHPYDKGSGARRGIEF